ncbi:helix-turn-helix domain-containing protein [Cerasicoccus arenae]|uniref:DNA-binding transcriptional regulator AraC n=1 Tax=Cerasicoccus arenae TaxID=424488 RepID=A0A8J3DCA5_9BACT|nr:helix-turn-helix domain-containing protein [Cerasicoccus arenae]MBK1858789.1 helix-turn-helix domain-containing protein [Cerasicoccus arenae]GHC04567.1 DNA-binding transcriptional regulator AraC [Cerasicoccus arenae]
MPNLINSPRIISAGRAQHDRHSPNRVRRPHGFPSWLLEYTSGGEADLYVTNGIVKARQHSLFLYLPGTRQTYENNNEAGIWSHNWVSFQPRSDWLNWLDWPPIDAGVVMLDHLALDTSNHVKSCFDDLVKVFHGPLPQREPLAMSLLEQLLLWCDSANPNSGSQRFDTRIQRSMAFICERYREPLTLESIAVAVGISPSRLAHLFPQEVGITPMRYLEQHRIEMARQRLAATSDSISDIAERVGYGSASYFSKVFRNVQGCTPRESRKRALMV